MIVREGCWVVKKGRALLRNVLVAGSHRDVRQIYFNLQSMNAAVATQFFRIKPEPILVSEFFRDERKGFFQFLRFALIEAATGDLSQLFH